MSSANVPPGETVTVNGMFMGPRNAITLGASPCSVMNTSNTRLMILIAVGTVSSVEFSRDGITFDSVGLVAGDFILNPQDSLRITYTIAPTVVSYPI